MLATGCSELLRKSLQGIQRSLGTLSGAQASSAPSSVFASTGGGKGGGSGGGRSLQLVGSAPCLWVEVAEIEAIAGCLPRDLPLARCRAAIDMHLFSLWRTCSSSNGVMAVEGAGSADVSRYLLTLLRVVHAKARATLVGSGVQKL